MHKLAMNGLRRPSADGMPEADANMPQPSEDGQDKVAALERYPLAPSLISKSVIPTSFLAGLCQDQQFSLSAGALQFWRSVR